jgi:predicted metal-dependent hydrolase
MITQIELGGMIVDIELKNIKNIHLSVYPPTGRVRISAPERMDLSTIRVYVISKLGWIKQQQLKFQVQERETKREYLERESHYVWGDRYLLHIIEIERAPYIDLSHKNMILGIRPGSSEKRRKDVVEEWYRGQVKEVAKPLIARWEVLMGVKVNRLYVQRMKTRWGTCNPRAGSIRLNTELAKKPRECIEYVIVHELAHLIEPSHNARFISVLDRFLPHWQQLKDELNRAPLGHVEWEY